MHISPLHVLLYGSRHEIAPGDLAFMEEQARRWMSDSRLSLEERERIRIVWLERHEVDGKLDRLGTYRPAVNPTPERLRQLDALKG